MPLNSVDRDLTIGDSIEDAIDLVEIAVVIRLTIFRMPQRESLRESLGENF